MNHRAPAPCVSSSSSSSLLFRCLPSLPGLPALALTALTAGCVPPPQDAMPEPAPPIMTEPLPTPLTSPPALSGGTLLILRDGKTAVAADPDRDALFVVDLTSERLLATVALHAGDQPGRLVQGADDTVFAVLRQGGAVVAVNPRDGTITQRAPVCAAPRGIGFDPSGMTPAVHVACAGGELVTMAANDLTETRRVILDRDLRDVVVSGDHLYVSRFRSAEVLRVRAADLGIIDRTMPPGSVAANQLLSSTKGMFPQPVPPPPTPDGPPSAAPLDPNTKAAQPGVAWRMRPLAGGGAVMLHQEASNGELGTSDSGGYGSGVCKGAMGAAVVEFHEGGAPPTSTGQIMFAALPIDFDISADGKRFAMIASDGRLSSTTGSVMFGSATTLFSSSLGPCIQPPPPDDPVIEFRPPTGEPVALAFDGKGRLVAQSREPARIEILTDRGGSIKLSDLSRADVGHQLFHQATHSGLACASCHPEGGDDGRVWRFAKIGARRTQNLLGGLAMTAPFHWDGDMKDFGQLMQEVFTGRMAGPKVDTTQSSAMNTWIDQQASLPLSAPRDQDAVARGKILFNDGKVGCATCHKGALLTDNTNRLVGTGSMLQVPSLRGLAARAPFMHDGCAKTLMDRFTDAKCGGGDAHGVTSHLAQPQLLDLVAYLETL
jgi:hypothetical protein